MCTASSGAATTYPRNATYSTRPERSRETIASRTGVGETSRSRASPSMLSREPGAQRDSSSRWRISSSTSARRTCRRTAIGPPLSVPAAGPGRPAPASGLRPCHPIGSRRGTCPAALRPAPSPGERVREPEMLGDDRELHLGGALPHLEHARVAVVAGHDGLVEEAVASPDLAGVARVGDGGLAAHERGEGGLPAERHPGVEAVRRLVHEGARARDPGLHAGEGEGDVLVLAEGAAEHHPLPRVPDGLLEAALGRSHAQSGERDPPLVEDGEAV